MLGPYCCTKCRPVAAAPGRRGAFTLIELLVVISIVSLLMAILLPVLKNARYQAQVTVCASQLRQLGIAGHLYAIDNDQHSPTSTWRTGFIENGYWMSDNEDGYYCPIEAYTDNNGHRQHLDPGWLYTLNIALASNTWPPTATPARLDDVEQPSRAMLFSDGGWRGPTFTHYNDYVKQVFLGHETGVSGPPHPAGNPIGEYGRPVSSGVNIVHVDGSSSFMKGEGDWTLVDLKANRNLEMNYKPFWGVNREPQTNDSWDQAPFE